MRPTRNQERERGRKATHQLFYGAEREKKKGWSASVGERDVVSLFGGKNRGKGVSTSSGGKARWIENVQGIVCIGEVLQLSSSIG